ncbi:Cyclic AMP-responsive element-binding protein 5 [Fukomys damarensis]|uniref:Cyclic AMP-responsive element-binding protein 5 n=1 Tax=Fukomys damarensis TaxID=885580 RepID=A0A091DKB2_FUKDA|nr:Cyclic AMP-responsive element-binding protein 5 [Fukomys damarensis]
MMSDVVPEVKAFTSRRQKTDLRNKRTFKAVLGTLKEGCMGQGNISMHNTVGGAMAGPGAHQLGSTRMPNHDTSVVIQQAMPSPQSSSVITQAPSTNRQIGIVFLKQEEELCVWYMHENSV